MSALACAGLVAYYEGNLNIALAYRLETRTTLSQLDIRLRTLEDRMGMKSLPIMIEPDWHSLAYRLSSLDRCSVSTFKVDTVSPLMMPEPANISPERLQAAVFGVPYRQGSHPPIDLKGKTEDEILSILVQRLCHVAGSRGYKMSRIPENQEQLCTAVVAISLEIDNANRFNRQGIPPPARWGRPGGLAGVPPPGRKLCCGCCTCSCHPRSSGSDTASTTSTSSSTVVESRFKKFFRFGWLRSVACWRKSKDVADDASSWSSKV